MPHSPSHIPRNPRGPFAPAGQAAAVALALALASSAAGAHELPVGDGHVTTHPAVGNVYACQTNFRGGGAQHTGSWFHGDMWDPDEKPHVQGHVMWPSAAFSMALKGSQVAVSGNGLPVDEPTGKFPIARSDPAYQYDRNPNSIRAQRLSFDLPATPVRAAQPGCLPMGMIGVATTGVAIYNALDDAGRDAAAHEVQDACDGHPQQKGQYHYHSGSSCIPGVSSNSLVGWALDGYPILGMRDAAGKQITNADLDACHGRAESVTIDGRHYDYAYRVTEEYPYMLGCFTGEVQPSLEHASRGMMGPRNGPPPPGRGAPTRRAGLFGRLAGWWQLQRP